MNIKQFMHSCAIMIFLLIGCEKYTDITPKGKNLLNRVSDLDLLMNVEYSGKAFNMFKQSVLINDMYPQAINIPNLISSDVKGLDFALVTYDEQIDRASLTATDETYEGAYNLIANVSNIVLSNADHATGDVKLAKQLKAEAYILRAYLHYILVNIYAKAYNPATAAIDGGIPYVENIDFETENTKLSVEEVYRKITDDLEAAFELDALVAQPKNKMRIGKGFAYAVKARVLLTLRDYEGAYAAAEEGLKYNAKLEDHRPFLSLDKGGQGATVTRDGLLAEDNLLYAYNGKAWPTTFSPTYEILSDYYESGNIIKDHTDTYNYLYGSIYSGLSDIPIFFAIDYQQNAAGLTTSDLYIVKAEALIRMERVKEGMDVVNYIRERRVYPYAPLETIDKIAAMQYLQQTSRIEFLFTWRNFSDVKRWVHETQFPVSVTRTVNGKTYTLSSGSPLWVFPFPQSATNFNTSLTQNY